MSARQEIQIDDFVPGFIDPVGNGDFVTPITPDGIQGVPLLEGDGLSVLPGIAPVQEQVEQVKEANTRKIRIVDPDGELAFNTTGEEYSERKVIRIRRSSPIQGEATIDYLGGTSVTLE